MSVDFQYSQQTQPKSNCLAIAGNHDAFRNNAFVACEISVTLESIMTFPKYGARTLCISLVRFGCFFINSPSVICTQKTTRCQRNMRLTVQLNSQHFNSEIKMTPKFVSCLRCSSKERMWTSALQADLC